jgi:hypothetical protein
MSIWSNDFDDLKEWVENIKETEGYKLAKNLVIVTNRLIITISVTAYTIYGA